MATVDLKDVRKVYGGRVEAVKGVSIAIPDGSMCVLVGPSGCGKSTLLRMIAGLEEITDGTVSIGGEVVNTKGPAERDIAMVFQNYALYPHMKVYDNMAYGLRNRGMAKDEIDRRVREAAATLGLAEFLERKPRELSGGQRQRVAMGRAIVREPKVFLMDEPLSNLDAELQVQMRVEISRLHKELGTTMIYVTHDQTEAMTLADKIVVLRGGNIEQIGAPLDLYDNPANQFVAGFVGSPKMNFMSAEVVAADTDSITITLVNQGRIRLTLPMNNPPPALGEKVTLGVRPEHFAKAGQGDADMTVTVDVAEHLGNTSYIYANVAGGEQLIIEREESRNALKTDTLTIAIKSSHALLFDKAGNRLR